MIYTLILKVAAGGTPQPVGCLGVELAIGLNDGFAAFVWMAAQGRLLSLVAQRRETPWAFWGWWKVVNSVLL